MESEDLIRVKGKPNTEHEGKEGTAIRTFWLNKSDGPIAVLWNGETEKVMVNLEDIDIVE